MKRIPMLLFFFSMLLVMVACTSKKTVESKVVLPEGIPDFVQKGDFENIDWKRKAVEFGDRGIIGNENISGIIGNDNTSLNAHQWMWHLWGIENVELTIVGFHKETKTIHPILYDRNTDSWQWTKGMMGAANGADSHMPSNVKFSEPGEWAILLYTNGKLFDTLVYEIK